MIKEFNIVFEQIYETNKIMIFHMLIDMCEIILADKQARTLEAEILSFTGSYFSFIMFALYVLLHFENASV